MPKLNVQIDHSIEVTPQRLAELFCDCDEHQQAEFFSRVAYLTGKWKTPFCFQLHAICDSAFLTPEGRAVMVEMGEYATEVVP